MFGTVVTAAAAAFCSFLLLFSLLFSVMRGLRLKAIVFLFSAVFSTVSECDSERSFLLSRSWDNRSLALPDPFSRYAELEVNNVGQKGRAPR